MVTLSGAALPATPTAFEAGRQVAPGARPTIVGPLCLDGGLAPLSLGSPPRAPPGGAFSSLRL